MTQTKDIGEYTKWGTLRKTSDANKKLEKHAIYPKVKNSK